MTRAPLPTSLGPELVFADGVWHLACAELPTVRGLSVLARALAEMAAAQLRGERVDIAFERRLRPRENPELIDRFGIDAVRLVAEREVAPAIADHPEWFEASLRAMLGSLQRQRFRDALLPTERTASRALVAEFAGAAACRVVLDFVPMRRDGARGALRFTIEGGAGRRLALDTLPHEWIRDIGERQFLAGSTRISQTWTEALRREAERGRRSFVERRDPHSHLFRQLDQAGLGMLQRVALHWSDDAAPLLLESEPDQVAELLKRVLLTLEDRSVRRLLAERETLRVDTGALPVFLDIAQLGRVLGISLGERRERLDVDAFLRRMPALRRVVAAHTRAPLQSVPVFLVHHMTAEVVGLIAALRALGCRDLCCLFVTYAGEPPASYLDAILDLPPDEFRAAALAHVPVRGRVGGHYRLSAHYSDLDEAAAITAALQGREEHYLESMRAAAVVPFLRQLARAEAAGQQCLLIEDGGYLAPVLHDAALRGDTIGAVARELGHAAAAADARPVADVLRARLIGTVEHTRNGFDKLAAVQAQHGRLALPAFSIAISRLKRVVESREVAAAILQAIEAVLNAGGLTLARRRALVLGSRGAIGRETCRALEHRLDHAAVLGVDLAAAAGAAVPGRTEARTLDELPADAWPSVDLVVGVTGQSVLRGADVERWLLQSPHDTLVLASGSTKRAEFADLMQWYDDLLRHPSPRLGGAPVELAIEELVDPRTARVYGHRWCFGLADGRRKAVWALGGLAPINFLFYGVANEIIDDVLQQLLAASLGLLRRTAAGGLAPRLHAVDRDIDADGSPLPGATT
ncbi:MAG: hypothetical protein JNL08_19650 [Planctomycetes bacterium]|nr:hypothetical protein [Planctomycetota bacterium]